jgi:hypothetical protein
MRTRNTRNRDDDDDYVVEDGGQVRVPLHLCDARQRAVRAAFERSYTDVVLGDRAPGYRFATDAASHDRAAARLAYLENLRDAWRSPQQRRALAIAEDAAGGSARDAYVRRLQDAWRTPSRDCAEPDVGSPPAPATPEVLGTPEAQSRRDAAYAQYRDQLQNAWRTDPRAAATAIERQGEQWRGGR